MITFYLLFSQFSLKHFYNVSSIPFIQHVNSSCIIFFLNIKNTVHMSSPLFRVKNLIKCWLHLRTSNSPRPVQHTFLLTWIFFLDSVFFCLQSVSAACSGWLQDRIIITSEPQPDVLLYFVASSVIARRGSRSQVPAACILYCRV